MATARYMVSICIAPGIPGYESAPSGLDHTFSSKADAIRFAKAVSQYFVKPDPAIRQGLTSMWALVYTFPCDEKTRAMYRHAMTKCQPFMCIDPGAVILWDRSSEIPEGFYGAPRRARESREAA